MRSPCPSFLFALALGAVLLPTAASATSSGSSGGSSSGGASNGSTGGSETAGASSSGSASDSGSSTGSDGTSGGSTDTGSTGGQAGTSTGAQDSGGPDDGACGCPTGDDAVTFASPADGAELAAPFEVVVEAVPRCSCDDCSCAAQDVMFVQLFVDTVAWGEVCTASLCTWEVTGTEGNHGLRAFAIYPDGDAGKNLDVRITSVAMGTGDDGLATTVTTTAAADGSTGSAGATGETPRGCGCTASPRPEHGALALLWAVLLRRRRRRD
ncbi:MAG: hypothetical protein IPH07_09945 [Deltaproteobacteria bacterium]|nr:hypothetical protein [Deltaproteobacteria bacterium]MBK8718756.1 hypothetical protein [Deltaproteobacteria bacterium]MBP7286467.1 hypothetical protein [Nannocystaceae bacterium]